MIADVLRVFGGRSKKGHLLRLKNGLFVFAEYVQKIRAEEIAFLIYQPSYISLERTFILRLHSGNGLQNRYQS